MLLDDDGRAAWAQSSAAIRQEEFQRERELTKAKLEPLKKPVSPERLVEIGE